MNLDNDFSVIDAIDTFYLHFKFKTKAGEWSINLPFLCNQCGICCTLDDFLTAGKVKINPHQDFELKDQLHSIYEQLGKLWETDKDEYDHYIMNTPCPFLKKNRCSIYIVRPEGCRQFPNTTFGMQTENCEVLNRFNNQSKALNKGRKAERSYHFTRDLVKQSKFSKEQYENCIIKLRKEGITEEELILFGKINTQTK